MRVIDAPPRGLKRREVVSGLQYASGVLRAAHPGPRGSRRRSWPTGILVAALAVTATTVLVWPLRRVAPVESLGVVYLVAVLLVSSVWTGWIGALTALASAGAFNWFHIPPTGRFRISEGENWVALAVFFTAAVIASSLGERARSRAEDVEQRRAEADLSAELARLLLRGGRLEEVLPAVTSHLAQALALPSAAIELRPVDGDERREAAALREHSRQIGTLVLPADVPEHELGRIQRRVVPSLEALLAAALERDELLGDVVETSALRRSDDLKTALLRSVSHDLRSPLTAILTANAALATASLTPEEHDELVADVGTEATRLSRLIDQLLDLSKLQAGAAEPRRDWCSIEEVIRAAVDDLRVPAGAIRLSLDRDLPAIRADAAQLERAFANLLENASRHSGGHPVSVRARDVGSRVLVRVVDRGPGVPPAQLERIFEPFHRTGTDDTGHRGAGLGLAITRGFVEVNGGRVWVESLPGQGTAFVVELPLDPASGAAELVTPGQAPATAS